jgi:predicted esterase
VSPETELLTRWRGDVDLLERPEEWHASFTMPARPVSLEAVVESRSEELLVTTFLGSTAHGKTIRYHAPPSPAGLVLFLHGTGGSNEMIEKPEARTLALTAIARGYAVLSPEAEEVVQGDMNGKVRWDVNLTPDNLDLANLNALVAWTRAQGLIEPTTPLFAIGMSNGGAMSLGLGAVSASDVAATFPNLRFEGVVSYCASGRATAAAVTTTPTAWFLCANDDNEEVSNQEARANSDALASRGIATEADAHPASPLYPERFTRVAGISASTSRGIADELRAAGFVGTDSMFTTPTNDIVAAVQADPSAFPLILSLPGARLLEIVDQMKVMQAEHQMYSDWSARTIDFLETAGAGP